MLLDDSFHRFGVTRTFPCAAIQQAFVDDTEEERRIDGGDAAPRVEDAEREFILLEARKRLVEPAERRPRRAAERRGAVNRVRIPDERVEVWRRRRDDLGSCTWPGEVNRAGNEVDGRVAFEPCDRR